MTYYAELQKMDIAKAVIAMVELALPRYTENRVFEVPLRLEIENFETKKEIREEVVFYFYRPSNYTFVGMTRGGDYINQKIEYMSHHDSAWRMDGVERGIRKVAEEVSKKFEGQKRCSVWTAFGIIGPRLIEGHIEVKRDGRGCLVEVNLIQGEAHVD